MAGPGLALQPAAVLFDLDGTLTDSRPGIVRCLRHALERLSVPCPADDVLASLTTMVWNGPSKSWTGGATMTDASLNRRMTVWLGDAVAFAGVGRHANRVKCAMLGWTAFEAALSQAASTQEVAG